MRIGIDAQLRDEPDRATVALHLLLSGRLSRSLCLKDGAPIKPRITVITVGVDDLESAVRCYRDGLGFKNEGIIGKEFKHGALAFFELQAGLNMLDWPRVSIADDSGLPLVERSATEFTLRHNLSSRTEVDAIMKQAQDAGLLLSSLLKIHYGEVMLAISKTLISTFGRCYRILSYCRRIRNNKSFLRTVKKLRFLLFAEFQHKLPAPITKGYLK